MEAILGFLAGVAVGVVQLMIPMLVLTLIVERFLRVPKSDPADSLARLGVALQHRKDLAEAIVGEHPTPRAMLIYQTALAQGVRPVPGVH